MSDRAILYASVSTGDKDTEASKLDAQLELCRERAEQEGYTVTGEHKEPEHTSGASQHPPELTKIIELAQQGEFDVLIARSLSRLARDITKQFRVERTLNKLGVRIEYYKYKFPDTAEGRLQKNMFAILAEYERENIAYRTNYGKRNKVKSGRIYVQGMPPYGYAGHIEKSGEGVDEIVKRSLVVDTEEAEVVQEIFEMYLSNRAVTAETIARHLTTKGIAPPGNKRYISEKYHVPADSPWNHATILKMLKRKTYMGTWEYGKKGNYESIAVQVEPIVGKLEYEDAQSKIYARRKSREHVHNYPYLLRNIAFCGVCGMPMRCKSDVRSSRAVRYYSYTCSKSHPQFKGERCDHTLSYRADIVDGYTWNDIKQLVADPTELKQAYEHYISSLSKQDNPINEKLQIKQRLVRKKELTLEKLLDEYLDGKLSKKRYRTRANKAEEAMNRYKAEVAALGVDLQAEAPHTAQKYDMEQYINQVPDLLSKTDGNEQLKMKVLEGLGVGVYMYPEGEYKNVNWALFSKSLRLEQTPSSLRVHLSMEIPRSRIILSRRLTFKLHTPYRNLDSVFVGVS